MDKRLIKFIERTYQMAQVACDANDVRLYASQVAGACCYEYERSGDMAAINIWRDEWREKFEKLA